MQKSVVILSLLFFTAFLACTKGPGTGGRAAIKGKIYARNYKSSPITLADSGYIGEQKVYIKYGNLAGVGDDVDTDNEGVFVFPYLRKGNYSIYTYTKTEGLFVGFSLDGSVMSHDFDQNVELYGNDISPEQIVESDDLISSYAVDEFLKTIQMITE